MRLSVCLLRRLERRPWRWSCFPDVSRHSCRWREPRARSYTYALPISLLRVGISRKRPEPHSGVPTQSTPKRYGSEGACSTLGAWWLMRFTARGPRRPGCPAVRTAVRRSASNWSRRFRAHHVGPQGPANWTPPRSVPRTAVAAKPLDEIHHGVPCSTPWLPFPSDASTQGWTRSTIALPARSDGWMVSAVRTSPRRCATRSHDRPRT